MKSNRLRLHTPSSSATNKWNFYHTKNYLHFDSPVNIHHVKNKIENPEWIKSHHFLPFISFDIVFQRYILNRTYCVNNQSTSNRKKENKTRNIMYASHIDQFIYKYYGEKLNEKYNEYVKTSGINEVVLAYRNNKKGKSNLDFSAEVFKFILSQEESIIISLDFSNFFDNINHKELKNNIKTVLNMNELPEDIYHVFKNTTKFNYIKKDKVNEYLRRKYGTTQTMKLKNHYHLKKIMPSAEFRKFKKGTLYKNKRPYGIPQGSGMSAVCSNIHLIHFDKDVYNWTLQHNALYRRYSDDLIIIIPGKSDQRNARIFLNEIMEIIKRYSNHGLKVQKKKTEVRLYNNRQIFDLEKNEARLDYLGIVMDGQNVQLREKSLFKYYTRAYRKAKVCRNITLKTGKKYERKKLYQLYTHLGVRYKGYGNFIGYVNRAHSIMQSIGLNSNIEKQTKRHWKKIHDKMNNINNNK